jgi:DegV family protein with EDD domain
MQMNQKVKIISDSTCDLSPEILEKYDITMTPLFIISGTGENEQEFRDKVDIQPDDLFRMVETEKKSCRTAAVNIYDYEKVFAEYSSKYESVIHINISPGFSACNQNASIAAADFGNVYVVDSRSLSSGQGYLVHDAAIMAKEGKSAQEIVDYLNQAAKFINTSFVINTLDYLHKGGRCSLTKLIASKILNIKPCIEVADGAMRVGAKYTGKFMPTLEKYVRERLSDPKNIDLKRIYITHTTCTPEIVGLVRETIKQCADFAEIIETKAGCTVSNHCGPNTLGIIFKQESEYQ